MLLKVVPCVLLVLGSIDAQPLSNPSDDTVKLIDEVKGLEQTRLAKLREALVKPEFRANSDMMRALNTFGELDRFLVQFRKIAAEIATSRNNRVLTSKIPILNQQFKEMKELTDRNAESCSKVPPSLMFDPLTLDLGSLFAGSTLKIIAIMMSLPQEQQNILMSQLKF